MTLQFYNVSDDPRVLRKTLGTFVNVPNVYMKDNQNIINPVFILQGDFKSKGNYCYCVELNRYYFVSNMTVDSGGKTMFTCIEDVLMTYADEISRTDVIVFNQGNDALADRLIADGRIPMQVNTTSRTHNFVNSEIENVNVGNYSYVLNCYAGQKQGEGV